MSAKGNPCDNAKVESFFKTLKREEVRLIEPHRLRTPQRITSVSLAYHCTRRQRLLTRRSYQPTPHSCIYDTEQEGPWEALLCVSVCVCKLRVLNSGRALGSQNIGHHTR